MRTVRGAGCVQVQCARCTVHRGRQAVRGVRCARCARVRGVAPGAHGAPSAGCAPIGEVRAGREVRPRRSELGTGGRCAGCARVRSAGAGAGARCGVPCAGCARTVPGPRSAPAPTPGSNHPRRTVHRGAPRTARMTDRAHRGRGSGRTARPPRTGHRTPRMVHRAPCALHLHAPRTPHRAHGFPSG